MSSSNLNIHPTTLAGMKTKPINLINPHDMDKTFHSKFIRHESTFRKLATADPSSYAAVAVRSMDHFTLGQVRLEEYKRKLAGHTCFPIEEMQARVVQEFSMSTRASEIFALWAPSLRSDLKNLSNRMLNQQGDETSDVNRGTRVCVGMFMTQEDPKAAIKFLSKCRKKYPDEVHFHRIYSDLFSFTGEMEGGLRACEEVCQLFPNHANVLYTRASLLRAMTDTGDPDYKNWAPQKRRIEIVKNAYQAFLKVAPPDHRNFAEANHSLAYLSLKYSTPSTSGQLNQKDVEELMRHYQNGLNAELNILPCFLPFTSETKNFVLQWVNTAPTTHIYNEGNTVTIDMTTNGMPGKPKPIFVDTTKITFISHRKPDERRIQVCVAYRKELKKFLVKSGKSDEEGAQSMDITSIPVLNETHGDGEFEDVILYQMFISKTDKVFTSMKIKLTVAEDPLYCNESEFLEMIVVDTSGDVVKLQLSLDSNVAGQMKDLLKKFKFGSEWILKNPHLYIINGNEKIIRADVKNLIRIVEAGPKCRACFKLVTPGQHCSRCKVAIYCGKPCQEQDWKILKHNLICCEEYKNFY